MQENAMFFDEIQDTTVFLKRNKKSEQSYESENVLRVEKTSMFNRQGCRVFKIFVGGKIKKTSLEF